MIQGAVKNIFKTSSTYGKKAWNKTNSYFRARMDVSTTSQMLSGGPMSNVKTKSLLYSGPSNGEKNRVLSAINSKVVDSRFQNMQTGSGNTVSQMLNNSTMKKTIGAVGTGVKTSAFMLGGTAMAGVAFMQGGMNQAQDIMYDRYMRDSRYSSRLLTRTSMGRSSGNSILNTNNHTGLSLALSRNRHG